MSVSFIVPAHNASDSILDCINGIKIQGSNNEILLICDSCTDNTYDLIESGASDVKIFKVNYLSAAKARNFGAKMAVFQSFIFVDSDVVLGENWLSSFIKARCKADLIIGGAEKSVFVSLSIKNFRPAENFLFIQKNDFISLDGFDESFKKSGGEDVDLVLRALKLNLKVYYQQVNFKHFHRSSFRKSIFRIKANIYNNFKHLDLFISWFWLLRKISGLVFFVVIFKKIKK
jgi:glycosyltransferase involved in cell wall biosynthesis